ELRGTCLDAGALHLERTVTVSSARHYEQLQLTSYAQAPIEICVSYELDADFRDMFEVRGIERAARGEVHPEGAEGTSIAWRYEALDGIELRTEVRFDPAPVKYIAGRADFLLRLEPRQTVTLNVLADCGAAEPGALDAPHCVANRGH